MEKLKFFGAIFVSMVIIMLVNPVRADSQIPFPDYRGWILDEEKDWGADFDGKYVTIRRYLDRGTYKEDSWTNMIVITAKKSEQNSPEVAEWVQWFNKENDEKELKVFRWDFKSKSYKLFTSSGKYKSMPAKTPIK